MKSERLRKLENEYQDLQQWLSLGLVPKKDLEKHKKEIEALKEKIEEEKQRLQYLKESGDEVSYVAPKRTPGARQAFPEAHTMPGVDMGEEGIADEEEEEVEETESFEPEMTFGEEFEEAEERTVIEEEEEEDPFSDKNRWRRGILEDPDVDKW